MPRNLTPAQIANKNLLESGDPWLSPLELTIPGGPTFRLVNDVQDLTFHSATYTAASYSVPMIPEHSADRVQQLVATVGDSTREIKALDEQYWGSADDDFWQVKIWPYVLRSVPDDTPLAAAEVYNVLGIEYPPNKSQAKFQLRVSGLSGTNRVPALTVTRRDVITIS